MELFKLFGSIAINNAEANQNIDMTNEKAKEAGKGLDDFADKGEKTESKLNKVFSKIGSAAVKVGKVIATGLAVGATAMTGLTVKALNLGGELEQNLGGSEAVFKEYAEGMQDIANKAYSNMGLSASDFLATANKMGSLFQGAGFDIKESADLSSRAMQRAADVASIMGISTESAMESIAGAAKGNFTMMDNLGVAMNDTAIQNYALSKGINKSTAEMTQQEKIGLAMEMFLDKTSYATGNYAKENETLAGSLGTAKAALSNFLSGSGTVEDVVTSFANAGNVIVKNLNTLVPRLVTGVTDLVDQIVPLLPPLLQSLLPGIINGAVQLVNGLVQALPTIINALMSALPSLINGIQKIFNALIMALPQIIQTLVAALPALIPQLVNGIVSMLVTLMTMLPQIIQPIIDNLPEIIISIVNGLMQNLPALIDGCIQLIVGLVQALPQIILALIEALPTVIMSIITGLWNSLPVLIDGIIQIVGEVGKSIWTYLTGWWNKLNEFFKGIWDGIKNVFGGVGDWFKNIFSGAVNGIKKVFSPISEFFKKIFGDFGDIIKAPVNLVIKGLNFLIKGLNKINFEVPDWVPGIGGKSIGFNIKEIPQLAKGGIVNKPTQAIIGEDGEEAVLPLENNTGWIKKVSEQIRSYSVDASSNIKNVVPYNDIREMRISEQKHFDITSGLLEKIIDVLSEYFPQFIELFDVNIVMDDGTLVGKLTPKIDRKLGDIYRLKKLRG